MVQTIYIEPNTGNLGIGTATPLQPLHIQGGCIISGNVGIGTTNPLQPLHVINTILTSNITLGTATLSSPLGAMPMFACRAWVNFDGTSAGTNPFSLPIIAKGNVTSVIRNSTGNYTVNYTTSMPSTSYASIITFDGTTTSAITGQARIDNKTTSNIIFGCFRLGSSAAGGGSTADVAFNSPGVSLAIFM